METEAQKRAKEKYRTSEKGRQAQKRWSEKYRAAGKGRQNNQRMRERQKLGRSLEQQRELFGLTQESLAEKLQLDVAVVKAIEDGKYYQIREDKETQNKVDGFLKKIPSNMDLPEGLPEAIVFLRKSRRKSQAWLGEQVCVSRQTVSYWESGRAVPSTDNLEKLETLFTLKIGQLQGKVGGRKSGKKSGENT